MAKHALILLSLLGVLLAAAPESNTGLLNVQSDRTGLKVYLDNDSIGRTPVVNYPVEPGEYWVTIFDPDSTQYRYDALQYGGLGQKLSTVWYLAKVQKGTARVSIPAGRSQEVFLSWRRAQQAPCQAKWLAAGCLGVPLIVGGLLGVLITALAR